MENLVRILPENTTAEIGKNSWDMPELFKLLREKGGLDEAEFYRVFNAGIGLVLVAEGGTADEVISLINATRYSYPKYFKSYNIGRITHSEIFTGEPAVNLI